MNLYQCILKDLQARFSYQCIPKDLQPFAWIEHQGKASRMAKELLAGFAYYFTAGVKCGKRFFLKGRRGGGGREQAGGTQHMARTLPKANAASRAVCELTPSGAEAAQGAWSRV